VPQAERAKAAVTAAVAAKVFAFFHNILRFPVWVRFENGAPKKTFPGFPPLTQVLNFSLSF
jgi:hypothetical protein